MTASSWPHVAATDPKTNSDLLVWLNQQGLVGAHSEHPEPSPVLSGSIWHKGYGVKGCQRCGHPFIVGAGSGETCCGGPKCQT